MRNALLFLLLLSAPVSDAFGRSWHLEPSTLNLATKILDRDITAVLRCGRIQVDRDNQADCHDVSFQIPRGIPSFLLVTTQASQRGRLTIHLLPDQLPNALQSAIPKEDWANPHKLFDFRTVVELSGGTHQEHVISLNRDFFESVTRAKRPFDLAGLQIGRVAFQLSVPAEEGQQFRVLRIRGWGLSRRAGADYLAGLASRLSARWKALRADSPVRRYWAGPVEQAGRRVRQFEAATRDDRSWWILQDELSELLLKSRTWLVDPNPRSEYLLGTASSLTRFSGRHENFGFSGPLSREVALEAARNEFESFQIVLLAPAQAPRIFAPTMGPSGSNLRTCDSLRRSNSSCSPAPVLLSHR
jgi:hypothetical protein